MEFWKNFKNVKITKAKPNKKFISSLTLLIFIIYILEFNSILANSFEDTNQILNETVTYINESPSEINKSTENNENFENSIKSNNLNDFDDESDEEYYSTQSHTNFSSDINTNTSNDTNIYNNSSNINKNNGTHENDFDNKNNRKINQTTIEEEIEIIKRKLMNSTFKIDDFYAKTVYDRLFEMFEPATDKTLNFFEIHKNLTRIIDTSSSNSNIADSYGVLTYLWFYGIPNKNGKLEFPYGWPRNIDIALRYALKGATKFNCGFCYTMMGLLFAWGYPPIVNNTHGWIGVDNSTSKIDVFKSSASKNTYFLYHNPYKYSNNMDHDQIYFPIEKNGFDLVFMNYALASKNKDIFGQLANSYYLRYSLSDITYQYDDLKYSSAFSLHRIPRNLTSIVGISSTSSSRCIVALEPLIFVASKTLSDHRDLFLPDISTLLRENKPKEHETKHYAEWVKSLAADRDPEGMTSLGELYYYGHEAGGIARDVNRAAQLWEESARRGDPQGALARAFLNLDGTMGTERDSGPYLRQVVRNGEPPAAALANYYIYKLGLDVDKNSTIAGEYLKLAADLGDGNAQLILAHAYAGGKMGVIPPGGQNDTLALKYYKLSAEGGRTVAYFNSAVLTLKGSDTKYKTEESRCIASIDYLTHVVKKNNHVKFLSLLSKRSYENGDIVGSLLREMTLSELGFIEGHINSQDLWKERSILYYNNEIKKLIFENKNDNGIVVKNEMVSRKELYSNVIEEESFLNIMCNIIMNDKLRSICKVELLDESNEKYSTLYPSEFDMRMSGISSSTLCLVKASRKEVFFNVPINFDNTIIHLNSSYFKYYDIFDSQNATLRGRLDLNYSENMSEKEKNRVSEFLSCWMRPRSYYDRFEKMTRRLRIKEFKDERELEEDDDDDEEEEESNIFDRLLELWQKPKSGSYQRYPKPWYKALKKIYNGFNYVYRSFILKLVIKLNNYFLSFIDGNDLQDVKEEGKSIFSRMNLGLDLDLDLEIDEEKVPEIIRLKRNSSLWCSHYYSRRSSSNGDIYSTQNLVQQFLEGSFGVNKDPVSAFKFIMQGVNSRDPKSILDYTIALNKGIGVKMDKPKSYRLLWHLITRGPFNIEDILPKIPPGPKYVPSILDTIRDTLTPLIKNNTNSTKGGIKLNSNGTSTVKSNNNGSNNSNLREFKESEGIKSSDFGEDVRNEDNDEQEQEQEQEEQEQDQDQDQDQDQSNSAWETKYKKGKRARMNDTINLNFKTQQDLATRISSLNILTILTLEWIYFNIFLRYYYSSIDLISKIWSSLLNLYQRNTNDDKDLIEKSRNKKFESNINKLINGGNGENNKNSDTCDNNICKIDEKIRSEIYCSQLTEKFCEYSEILEALKEYNKKSKKKLEEDLVLMMEDDDPFPLSSKFRYISDEEYGKASNIWKASISIRLYYFILRIVIIIGTISVLIPLNIAITDRLNH
ncbi:Sel1-like repeat containing protein [Cryptosporidium hominis]|uniref:Sel1-like repeat containing protein n=1 Tax=Cryptosporidium hominis TaxID=237895 RepID=A0ABX5B9A6_CRYHO|nr:Sel1-like repeat containing protein [Cryptosporidium hominis]|eukprot:PPS92612.1 Sel1-like repeat containing protein [Cryptosporidium hominis]